MTPSQWNEEFAGLIDRLLAFGSMDAMEHRQAEKLLGEYRDWRLATDRAAEDARMFARLERETFA